MAKKIKKAQVGAAVDSVSNEIMLRQLYRESRFKDKAFNKGTEAAGLAQIRPIAVKDLKQKGLNIDPLKPLDAIKGHKKLMTDAYNKPWIDKKNAPQEVRDAKTLAAYNMGATSLINALNAQKKKGVDINKDTKWIKSLPQETQDYIRDAMGQNPVFEEEYKKAAEKFKYKGAYPMKQNGGSVNVDSVLNANKGLDWVKRLYEKDTPSVQIPGQDGRSTHFMESGDGRVYPKVVNENGKLKYLGDKAYDYADSTKTFIQFPNDEQAQWFGKHYKEGKGVLKNQQGGVIEDNRGQWAHPGKVTKINSNNITMKGVPYPVLGVSDTGQKKMMKPGKNYKFKGKSVTEFPIAQNGIEGLQANLQSSYENQLTQLQAKAPQYMAQGQESIAGQTGGGGMTGMGLMNMGTGILQGVQMLGEEKKQRNQAKQYSKLSGLANEVASLPYDGPKRKYVRPEDMVFDPNQMSPSYGTGTNFLQLKKGGKVKAQFGAQAGSLGAAASSKLFGGTGQQSGAGQIGTSVGSGIGSIFGPVGEAIGGFAGGFIGGAFGAKGQDQTRDWQNEGNFNASQAAFKQAMQGQFSASRKNGGPVYAMGGDLKTHWGGRAEEVSTNPYLPGSGESVEFIGDSHKEGGIGVTFGNSPVEVEGGEPAVKLQNGGKTESLVVFGDMKIPSYGVSEIGDPKAKGKKFKNYVSDLNKQEANQNKVVSKGVEYVNEANPNDSFERLSMNSGEAMMIGGNMKLKNIATKKNMASIIQNAILETAAEKGLKSDELAKGIIKKDKSIKKTAQDGTMFDEILNPNPYKHDLGFFRNPNPTIAPHTGLDWNPITNPKPIGALYSNPGDDLFKTEIPQFKSMIGKTPKDIRKKDPIVDTTPKIATKEESLNNPFEMAEVAGGAPDSSWQYKTPAEKQQITQEAANKGLNVLDYINAYLPYLRPSNQKNLDPNQLMGEMFALSNNNLEPVQAQKYSPLLETPTKISYQDALNANQSDFNRISRQLTNNPEALASLAGQKYSANSQVIAEQERQNQDRVIGAANRNRGVLNDATLKNLAILDQQYTRQASAKSNTKAVAQAALSSISDKIAKNKLENRTLGIYENMYNYRFGPQGRAWNMNAPAQFNTEASFTPAGTEDGITQIQRTTDRDSLFRIKNIRDRVTTKKSQGGIVKALKGY